MESQKKTYYEFFCGGGMVRAALGGSWKCLVANDNCIRKATSYRANWGDGELIVRDVQDLTKADLPGVADLAWASFPCQDLSLAGAGAGLNGDRSGTFWSFWELIKRLHKENRPPRTLVLENVYGAITSHGGKDFQAIAHALSEIYRFGALVIDAVHFVPQSRPRLFVIAVDDNKPIPSRLVSDVPSPSWHPRSLIGSYNGLPQSVKDKWLWWNLKRPTSRLKTLEDLIEDEPQGIGWHSAEETAHILSLMTPLNRRKLIEAQIGKRRRVGTIYRRTRDGRQRAEIRFDGISGCLRTPSGGSSRQTIVVVQGSTIRTRLLSPREAARLMGLRDKYKLPARYNDAYHLAGDGVVVPVVRHLARQLLSPLVSSWHQVRIKKAA